MKEGLTRLYGKSLRMVIVSVSVTFVYIALVALLNWSWIASISNFAEEKLVLDQSVDPWVKYPRAEIEKAKENVLVGRGEFAYTEPRWKEGYGTKYGQASMTAIASGFEQLNSHQHRREIAFLTLLRGYSWEPGPLWGSMLSLLLFNVMFDLIVVVSVMAGLSRLAEAAGAWATVLYSLAIVGITAVAYTAFLVPTSYLFEGYDASYWLLLLGLPFAALLVAASITGIVQLLIRVVALDFSNDDAPTLTIVMFVLLSWLIVVPIVREVAHLGWPRFEYPTGAAAIPYALASCSVAPGLLTIVFLALAFGIRIAGGLITAPLIGYLGFVLDTPRMVGFSMLVLPLDFGGQRGIGHGPHRGRALHPCVIAAGGDIQDAAHHSNGVTGPVLAHELEPFGGITSVSRANQAAAFERISRSNL